MKKIMEAEAEAEAVKKKSMEAEVEGSDKKMAASRHSAHSICPHIFLIRMIHTGP